ncbi:MAG TPA: protein TolR [Acidiferrobacteraceae bacterium]|nr:protein TolR [Acidiferrobacteraceae bacterium]
MIARTRKRRRVKGEINVVPYIDVMLVLLVIFMVTAPLLKEAVKVRLPKASTATVSNPDRETLVVTVDRQGHYYLDNRPITPEKLGVKVAAILRLRPKTPVLIRGDQRVAYEKVVRAMALLEAAGAPSVGLLTEPGSHHR